MFQPGMTLTDHSTYDAVAESELGGQVPNRGTPAERLQHLIELALPGAALEKSFSFQQRRAITRKREHSFREHRGGRIRGLYPQGYRVHPKEPLEHVPKRPFQGASG
jgi:hypothetical protein